MAVNAVCKLKIDCWFLKWVLKEQCIKYYIEVCFFCFSKVRNAFGKLGKTNSFSITKNKKQKFCLDWLKKKKKAIRDLKK